MGGILIMKNILINRGFVLVILVMFITSGVVTLTGSVELSNGDRGFS